jgi:uncharacterized membrane protein YhfC
MDMDAVYFAHLLNGALMIALPVGLGVFLTRRWNTGWRLWWIGAATFVLSQAGHIPFNAAAGWLLNRTPLTDLPAAGQTLFNAAFLGLSAGLFEELSRYAMFRFWAKDARSWRTGILTGAGHGGAEAALLGLLALYGFLQLAALRDMDLGALFPADQVDLARQQVTSYWSMTWYDSLLGALERAFTIPVQICFAVIVLQGFVRRQGFWVWLAVAFHAIVDASAVVALRYLGVYGAEAVVAGFTVLSLIIIFRLRRPEPASGEPLPPTPPAPSFEPQPLAETPERLEDTRFAQ